MPQQKIAFCANYFHAAFEKCTIHKLDHATNSPGGDKQLNVYCMPVVVELRDLDWRPRPTHLHGRKYYFQALPDFKQVLAGVVITAL